MYLGAIVVFLCAKMLCALYETLNDVSVSIVLMKCLQRACSRQADIFMYLVVCICISASTEVEKIML